MCKPCIPYKMSFIAYMYMHIFHVCMNDNVLYWLLYVHCTTAPQVSDKHLLSQKKKSVSHTQHETGRINKHPGMCLPSKIVGYMYAYICPVHYYGITKCVPYTAHVIVPSTVTTLELHYFSHVINDTNWLSTLKHGNVGLGVMCVCVCVCVCVHMHDCVYAWSNAPWLHIHAHVLCKPCN